MRVHRSVLIRTAAIATAGIAALAACGSGSGGTGSSSAPTSSAVPSSTPSTPSSPSSPDGPSSSGQLSTSTTTGSPSVSFPSPPGTASIPIHLATGANGRHVPLVDVEVGGGKSVPVILDTGSIGLMIARGNVGSQARSTAKHFTMVYGGFSLTANLATARVTLHDGKGAGFTSLEMGVGAVTSPLTGFMTSVGAAGILGIAAGSGDTGQPPVLSPLAEMAAPLSSGYLIDESAGVLTLGPPSTTGAVTVPMTTASWKYPSGELGYVKPVTAQWTIGNGHITLPTVFDTGSPQGFLPRSKLPMSLGSGTTLPAGTAVQIALGGHTVTSFSSGQSGAPSLTINSGKDIANSGEPIFEHNRIGIDLEKGVLIIASV